MIEPTMPQGVIEYTRHGLRFSLRIAPARYRLFRRWAEHLGLTDAGLAARIFNEGTIQLALLIVQDQGPMEEQDKNLALAGSLLDDLECHLDDLPTFTEGQHAPNHR